MHDISYKEASEVVKELPLVVIIVNINYLEIMLLHLNINLEI